MISKDTTGKENDYLIREIIMKHTAEIFKRSIVIAMAAAAVFSVQSVHAEEIIPGDPAAIGTEIEESEMLEPVTTGTETTESGTTEAETFIAEREFPEESLEYVSDEAAEEADLIRDSVSDLPFGSVGRLYSEDLGINVKVEYYDMCSDENSNEGAQSIVNKEDTAIWMDWHINTIVIGDHYNQGFESIKKSVPGETVIYMISQDGMQKFICQDVQEGHNDGKTLLAEDGSNLLASDPGGLLLYTCDGSWKNIFIAQYAIATE